MSAGFDVCSPWSGSRIYSCQASFACLNHTVCPFLHGNRITGPQQTVWQHVGVWFHMATQWKQRRGGKLRQQHQGWVWRHTSRQACCWLIWHLHTKDILENLFTYKQADKNSENTQNSKWTADTVTREEVAKGNIIFTTNYGGGFFWCSKRLYTHKPAFSCCKSINQMII